MTDACAPEDRGASLSSNVKIPDFVLLYFTLVADQAIPHGFLWHFLSLEPQLHAAADQADPRNAAITNVSAAQWLHHRSQFQAEEAHGRKAQRWINLYWHRNSSQGGSGRAGRRPHSRVQRRDKMQKQQRGTNGSMFLPILYCRRLHPREHFFVRMQQVAECWVPAGEQVRFEHEYGRFANFPAGSQAPPTSNMHLAEVLGTPSRVQEGQSSSRARHSCS